MGALEDDLDAGLRQQRQENYNTHDIINPAAGWDDRICRGCSLKGGVDLSFNKCIRPRVFAEGRAGRRSALQDWVMDLTIMQQSVLIASVRGPDGIRKNHPVKVLCRWFRRSFMISAFERIAILDPYAKGGGSFTGPVDNGICDSLPHAFELYLASVDELPHHFQLHFMHGAEILGYKHPDMGIRQWWNEAYLRLVNDAHLFPESEEQMDKRLGDNEEQWRRREEVTAQ